MPLIIVTGLPCSGKTYRACQILTDFESRISAASTEFLSHVPKSCTVQLLASSHASIDPPQTSHQDGQSRTYSRSLRDRIYNSARDEKTARAEEFSAIKRALNKNNIIITDAPNYIKGFRYQLWCEAKAVGTRSVVVHVAAREDECKAWNDERIKSWGWEELYGLEEVTKSSATTNTTEKDTRGDLQPESHTAIYGDRPLDDFRGIGTRSRSSSVSGNDSNEETANKKEDLPETMTLRSLYISNNSPNTENNGHVVRPDASQAQSITSQASETTAPSDPPLPTASLPYTPATLQSLSMRYEPPSPFTRWDTPLFTVPSADAHPPYQAIWNALFPPPIKATKKATSQLRPGEHAEAKSEEVRRHAATVLPKATGAEALQTLESATADVVKLLLAAARERGLAAGDGGDLSFSVPDPKTDSTVSVEVEVPPNMMLSQPLLQRLRRKYTQIQRGGIAHGQGYASGRTEVVRDFSQFLQTEWNAE